MKVVIALGSNLGDRADSLNRAITLLKEYVKDHKVSSFLETEPVSDIAQPKYLNAVMIGNTVLMPQELLEKMQKIESELGRIREKKWDARTIDLDLIIYGDQVIDTDFLKLPHPLAASREFVLAPWIAIDPEGEIPGKGSIKSLLASIQQPS